MDPARILPIPRQATVGQNCCRSGIAAAFSIPVTWLDIKTLGRLGRQSRMGRLAEGNPLATALVLSVMIHLALFGAWKVGDGLGWWKHSPEWLNTWTRWLAKTHFVLLPKLIEARLQPPPPAVTIPVTFVEVDPETATPEPPQNARYYSSLNAKASNPDATVEKETPKIESPQDKVPRVMEKEKEKEEPKPFPLQPTAPTQPKPEEAGAPDVKPGDMALRKPSEGELPMDTVSNRPKDRPRTLAAARAAKGLLSGEPIKSDGGVRNRGKLAFDTKSTPFGEYDRLLIAAVEQTWHQLLEDHRGNQRSGRVVVTFKLNSDGRITELRVADNDAGEIYGLICQRAILDPAPFKKWPPDMLRTIGAHTRELRFTFYYN